MYYSTFRSVCQEVFLIFQNFFSTALSVGCPLDYIDSIAQNMGFVKMAYCTKIWIEKVLKLVIFHNSAPGPRSGAEQNPTLNWVG
jgi:hypothetical protein